MINWRAIFFGPFAWRFLVAFFGIVLLAGAVKAAEPMIIPPVIPARPHDEPELDVELMLAVIRDIESNNNPAKIGKKYGERSAYQFMPAVWKFYTKLPFETATKNPAVADLVAHWHLAQLRKELTTLMLPFTPEFIYAAWRHGSPHAANHARDDDAQRAFVLYRSKMEAKG